MYRWRITDCWPIVGDCVLGDEATISQTPSLSCCFQMSKCCCFTNPTSPEPIVVPKTIFFKNLSLSKPQSGLPLTTTSLNSQKLTNSLFQVLLRYFNRYFGSHVRSFSCHFISISYFISPCFQFNFSSISAHYFRSHVQVSRSNHCSLMNNCSLNTSNHTCIGYCSPKVLVKSTD